MMASPATRIEPRLARYLSLLRDMPRSTQASGSKGSPGGWLGTLVTILHTGRVESLQKSPKFPYCVEPMAIAQVAQVDVASLRDSNRPVTGFRCPVIRGGKLFQQECLT